MLIVEIVNKLLGPEHRHEIRGIKYMYLTDAVTDYKGDH